MKTNLQWEKVSRWVPRDGGQWEATTKRQEEITGHNGYVHYHDYSDGLMGTYTSNLIKFTL